MIHREFKEPNNCLFNHPPINISHSLKIFLKNHSSQVLVIALVVYTLVLDENKYVNGKFNYQFNKISHDTKFSKCAYNMIFINVIQLIHILINCNQFYFTSRFQINNY